MAAHGRATVEAAAVGAPVEVTWFKRLFKQPESPRGHDLTQRVEVLEEKAQRVEQRHEKQEALNRELRRAYYHIMGERRYHTIPHESERRHP